MNPRIIAERLSSFRGRLVSATGFDEEDFAAIDAAIAALTSAKPIVTPTVTRNRKALLIGIDYRGTASQLGGCVADARNWGKTLNGQYDTTMLLDRDASRAGIRREVQQLVATPNADLILCYSGHGTQVPDRGGDESDRRDEAICPNDFERSGVILDDEIGAMFEKLPADSRLLVVMDCCHSGSNARTTVTGRRRSVPWNKSIPVPDRVKRPDTVSDFRVATLAACRDNETAADTGHSGAFTDALLGTIHEGGTLAEWCERAARRLREGGFQQHPVASGAAGQVKEFFS